MKIDWFITHTHTHLLDSFDNLVKASWLILYLYFLLLPPSSFYPYLHTL